MLHSCIICSIISTGRETRVGGTRREGSMRSGGIVCERALLSSRGSVPSSQLMHMLVPTL